MLCLDSPDVQRCSDFRDSHHSISCMLTRVAFSVIFVQSPDELLACINAQISCKDTNYKHSISAEEYLSSSLRSALIRRLSGLLVLPSHQKICEKYATTSHSGVSMWLVDTLHQVSTAQISNFIICLCRCSKSENLQQRTCKFLQNMQQESSTALDAHSPETACKQDTAIA